MSEGIEMAKKRVLDHTEQQESPAMSFFDQLSTNAEPYRKPVYTSVKDPMTVMRNKLYDAVMAQVTALESGEKATPVWYNADDDVAFEMMVKKALAMQQKTGVKHVIDHIVPLQGRNVCGLHWRGNWQILTKSENSKKSNKHQ